MTRLYVSIEVRLRLRDGDGRYFMMVMGGRLRRKEGQHLMPPGGAIKVSPKGREAFRRQLGALLKDDDLRFFTNDVLENTTLIEKLTADPRNLEIDAAWREFEEEFCLDEGRHFLTAEEVRSCSFTSCGEILWFRNKSIKRDMQDQETLYGIELYDVIMQPNTLEKLLVRARKETVADAMFEFATATEITQGKTGGSKIHSMYTYLLS
jgi:hypothetical protein